MSLFSFSFILTLWSAKTAESTIQQVILFVDDYYDNYYYNYYYYSFEIFLYQRQQMDFYWSLSDSKSPQVSRTLLCILAVFNNAVVWMVSTRLPTSKSSRSFNNPLVTETKATITIGTIVTFIFHGVFNSLARSRYLSFFSHSFSYIQQSARTAKSTILQTFVFVVVDYYKVWSSGQDQVICVYVKIRLEFMCVNFKDRSRVLRIPFVRMVKFKFLAHFSLDHLAHPIVIIIIFIIIIISLRDFIARQLMVIHRSLSDNKSPQVSRTLLSILSDLKNIVVRMDPSCPLISDSSSPFPNPFVTVTNAQIIMYISVPFIFHNYFSSLAISWYLFLFSLSFIFALWSTRAAKPIIRQDLSFLFTITRSARLAVIQCPR